MKETSGRLTSHPTNDTLVSVHVYFWSAVRWRKVCHLLFFKTSTASILTGSNLHRIPTFYTTGHMMLYLTRLKRTNKKCVTFLYLKPLGPSWPESHMMKQPSTPILPSLLWQIKLPTNLPLNTSVPINVSLTHNGKGDGNTITRGTFEWGQAWREGYKQLTLYACWNTGNYKKDNIY